MSNNIHPTAKISKDDFINEELLIEEPFSFDRRFTSTRKRTIGKLGNGILRPKYRTITSQSNQDITRPLSAQNLLKLTDKDKTEKLSQQVATSIQNRIDKATLENQEQQVTTESNSKKSNTITGILIVSGLIVTSILIYVFKRSTPLKLKTVKS